jgi:hypothetical protein
MRISGRQPERFRQDAWGTAVRAYKWRYTRYADKTAERDDHYPEDGKKKRKKG